VIDVEPPFGAVCARLAFETTTADRANRLAAAKAIAEA
jgi:hypothetical protein